MAKYAADLVRTASLTLPVGTIGSSATVRRTKLYDVVVGQDGTVGDTPTKYTVQRCTALGTSTAVTPLPLDPADAAALTVAGENHTVDATQTANQIALAIALNQRATFRWCAVPGSEIVTPATSANGLAFNTVAGALVAVTVSIMFEEQ